MKTCPKCTKSKSLNDFCVRSKSKDGRQPWCKECTTKRFKEYYKENPVAYKERAAKIEKEARDLMHDLKDNKPCVDCNRLFPFYVLDYHHKDSSKKTTEVGNLTCYGKARVLEEIQKCDLLCANCHRLRTHVNLPTKWLPR